MTLILKKHTIVVQGRTLTFDTYEEVRRAIAKWSERALMWEEGSSERTHCYAVAADLTDWIDIEKE